MLRAVLEYDGTDFAGWARQPGLRTVEGEFLGALATLEGGVAPTLHVAGRTDAGVHASGQVVSWRRLHERPLEDLRRALNSLTPPDISVLSVEAAAPGFDARRSATARHYSYLIHLGPVPSARLRRFCWEMTEPLDLEVMAAAAATLEGAHDFSAFAKRVAGATGTAGTDSAEWGPRGAVRTILRCRVLESAQPWWAGADGKAGGGAPAAWVRLEVAADSFLYRMVRSMVGTLVEVACGARSPDSIARLLSGGGGRRGVPAPACGLTLVRVEYEVLARA